MQYPDGCRQAEQGASERDAEIKGYAPDRALALQGIQQAICHVVGRQDTHEIEYYIIAEQRPQWAGEDGRDHEEQTHDAKKSTNPTRRADGIAGEGLHYELALQLVQLVAVEVKYQMWMLSSP